MSVVIDLLLSKSRVEVPRVSDGRDMGRRKKPLLSILTMCRRSQEAQALAMMMRGRRDPTDRPPGCGVPLTPDPTAGMIRLFDVMAIAIRLVGTACSRDARSRLDRSRGGLGTLVCAFSLPSSSHIIEEIADGTEPAPSPTTIFSCGIPGRAWFSKPLFCGGGWRMAGWEWMGRKPAGFCFLARQGLGPKGRPRAWVPSSWVTVIGGIGLTRK